MKEKNDEKSKMEVFTKKKRNNIIKKDYNPLKVNYDLIYEREGILMCNNVVLDETKKLSKKYNKKEKVILKMFELGINNGCDVDEIKKMISEFEDNSNCY